MGHKRRYSVPRRGNCWKSQGFTVERTLQFNKAGAPPWWIYSRLAGTRRINKPVLKIFDKTVWIWRRLDGILPWGGLSLVVVAREMRRR